MSLPRRAASASDIYPLSSEPDQPAPRMLPHRRVDEANMDVNSCIERCHQFGFPAAGLEYGE